MLTKYILDIKGEEYELRQDDLRNWDDIKVSYKRSDYDGVVRSFSSQFEFVNKARELLWSAYLKSGVNTSAEIAVYVINDKWGYEERFRAPLDFSTIQTESFVLKLNSVDNSISSKIKANKGSKFEFIIGEDIVPDRKLLFDRIPMLESAVYEFTQGASYEGSADIRVSMPSADSLPWIGLVGSETIVNKVLYYVDDQNEDTPYLLKAVNDVEVTLDYDLAWKTYLSAYGSDIGSVPIADTVGLAVRLEHADKTSVSRSQSIVQMMHSGRWKKIDDTYYEGGLTPPASIPQEYDREYVYSLVNGIVYKLTYNGRWYEWHDTGQTEEECFTETARGSLTFNMKTGDRILIYSGTSSGDAVPIRFVKSEFKFNWIAKGDPVEIEVFRPQTIATALVRKLNCSCGIRLSTHDTRLANTYLMAAESARGLTGAKFYTSFQEFCDWMQTVFGYTYTLVTYPNGGVNIHFLHRTEIFSNEPEVREFTNTTDHTYSLDTSLIYSEVTIGYDAKNYESVNGRDEFNFNTTYTTGCTVTDSKLSLLSKYRADCYGIEFAVQKRGEDSTDSSSDQDVFFLLCTENNAKLIPDRSIKIENALTDSVFNGAFSPRACVLANQEYIAMMCYPLSLSFASTTGNANIKIDGLSVTSGLLLPLQIATAGILEFSTDEVDEIAEPDALIKVTDREGNQYSGFLLNVDISYSKTETAKYKILIRSIES